MSELVKARERCVDLNRSILDMGVEGDELHAIASPACFVCVKLSA